MDARNMRWRTSGNEFQYRAPAVAIAAMAQIKVNSLQAVRRVVPMIPQTRDPHESGCDTWASIRRSENLLEVPVKATDVCDEGLRVGGAPGAGDQSYVESEGPRVQGHGRLLGPGLAPMPGPADASIPQPAGTEGRLERGGRIETHVNGGGCHSSPRPCGSMSVHSLELEGRRLCLWRARRGLQVDGRDGAPSSDDIQALRQVGLSLSRCKARDDISVVGVLGYHQEGPDVP